MGSRRKRTLTWLPPLVALVVGVFGGVQVALHWRSFLDAHAVGAFGRDFATSAGFGGLMTLAAAGIAVWGVRSQLRLQAESARRERRRHARTARDAEWWRSFEWTAARALPSSPGESAQLDDALAFTLASVLQQRARTRAQTATCDALVNQIATRNRGDEPPSSHSHSGPSGRWFEPASDGSASSLRDYITRARRDDRSIPQSLVGAEMRLFELQIRDVLNGLRDDDLVDDVRFGDDPRIKSGANRLVGRPDAVVKVHGDEFVVEFKLLGTASANRVHTIVRQVSAFNSPLPVIVILGGQLTPPVRSAMNATEGERIRWVEGGDPVSVDSDALRAALIAAFG